MRLWYKEPAEEWSEALPTGNGFLGGMVYGNPFREKIQLNEDSIWSGKPLNRRNPDALNKIVQIRDLIKEGRITEAEKLSIYALSGIPNSQRAYQTAGELYLTGLYEKNYTEYERELNLDEGFIRVKYVCDNTIYSRTIITSSPDQVMAIHLTANGKEKLNFDCLLGRCHNWTDEAGAVNQDTIYFQANTGKGGMDFCVMLRGTDCDGTMEVIGEHLVIREASCVTLYLAIVSSYRVSDVVKTCTERLNKASKKGYEKIYVSHTEDYRKLFQRMYIKLGNTDREDLPTDERLKAIKAGEEDEGLYALYVQYGRYLLMSSSREGSLPCNLQGIWNDSLMPPWDSKYTININTEMNYWHAESTNLSECHLPFFELLDKVKEDGKRTAREMYGCHGSVAHHNTDIYGDSVPQDHYIPASYWVMGEAWMATHIWEHYQYTNDRDFLKKYFDVYEQCVLFFYDFLVEKEDGSLVTSPSVSPENTYIMNNGIKGCICEGAVMDVEILIELYNGYIQACKILGEDKRKIKKAQEILKKLPGFKIGKYGQLQEWQEDYDEAEPGHRHISHLYGVYPGSSLNWVTTPEYMKAAKVALERRLTYGGGHTGWSRAWIVGLWARFGEGEKAYENIQKLLIHSTFSNLMDNHPWGEDEKVFQIDGNMGAAAAVIEMLVQCHDGIIRFLPALPNAWINGQIMGIRLRGGITLDMAWKDKKVFQISLCADVDKEITLLIDGGQTIIWLQKNIPYKIG